MALFFDGSFAGLGVWGYGIKPAGKPNKLFDNDVCGVSDYVELSRFFVLDWTPPNTASKFLSFTHRKLKQHTDHKWLYTYAAGFQGLTGTIYQASNYDYIGREKCSAFTYIPGKGLIHDISCWHRWSTSSLEKLQKIFSDARRWHGYNFAYIYWLCSQEEKQRLMRHANFDIKSENPDKGDIRVWTEDVDGNKESVSIERAKQVPVIKLNSSRGQD
jgi:hypothetical protein